MRFTFTAQLKSTYTFKVRLVATAILYALMVRLNLLLMFPSEGALQIECSIFSIQGLTVSYLVWNYRSQPIVILPEKWLSPIGSWLSPSATAPGKMLLIFSRHPLTNVLCSQNCSQNFGGHGRETENLFNYNSY